MMTLEKFNEQEETRKNRVWKALTPYQKHIAAMYFYRIATDSENMTCYLETARFTKMGICPTDLPDFIFFMKPRELRSLAFEVINEKEAA